MTVACIHQPQYIPYLGFFHKLAQSDIYVIHDDIAAIKADFTNRNRIRTPQGWIWLTIPVVRKEGVAINQIKLNNTLSWRKKHWQLLTNMYGRSRFFKDYADFFEDTYNKEWEFLADFDIHLLRYISNQLDISTEFVPVDSLSVDGKGDDKLISICRSVGADTYLSGIGGKDYIEERKFEEANIKLMYQEFTHPVYEQRFEPFEPNLSVVDLLFNNGTNSLDIIMRKNKIGK